MPSDHRTHVDWLGGIIDQVDKQRDAALHPVLQEFQQLIESNSRVYMLIASMLQQVPNKEPYTRDPTGSPQIRDYHHFLSVLNHLLTSAPSWNDKSHRVGLVGLPINAMLDWPMGTPSGYAAFLDPDINAMIKKILNAWGEFLKSPQSTAVLTDSASGWFSSTGISDLTAVANVETQHTFDQLYICDPSAPSHGFKSWDDFFTRRFRDGIRPVAEPGDDSVIANACESEPYRVARDVKARDHFWLKGQPYSVLDMLGHDEFAAQFTGGTVYQAFLNALSYHRWHAPVSGTIIKAYVQPGTYYSEPLFEGPGDPQAQTNDIDMAGETISQSYLTAVATRAIIFIQADHPAIGLIAFIGVGMYEVSTCEMTVKKGDYVSKGDQIGMFHFGGSTHCLLFRPGVNVTGFPEPDKTESNVPVRSRLAVVQ